MRKGITVNNHTGAFEDTSSSDTDCDPEGSQVVSASEDEYSTSEESEDSEESEKGEKGEKGEEGDEHLDSNPLLILKDYAPLTRDATTAVALNWQHLKHESKQDTRERSGTAETSAMTGSRSSTRQAPERDLSVSLCRTCVLN